MYISKKKKIENMLNPITHTMKNFVLIEDPTVNIGGIPLIILDIFILKSIFQLYTWSGI